MFVSFFLGGETYWNCYILFLDSIEKILTFVLETLRFVSSSFRFFVLFESYILIGTFGEKIVALPARQVHILCIAYWCR